VLRSGSVLASAYEVLQSTGRSSECERRASAGTPSVETVLPTGTSYFPSHTCRRLNRLTIDSIFKNAGKYVSSVEKKKLSILLY
jgi:hypothetical protein